MRSIERVRSQIWLGIGGYLAIATGVACGGTTTDPTGGAGATPGTGGTTSGSSGSGGTGGAPAGGSGGSAGSVDTGGGGATVGGGGSGGTAAGGTGGAAGRGGSPIPEGGLDADAKVGCATPPLEAPQCTRTTGSFFDDVVCFTEGALTPYRINKPDPNRDACALICPAMVELTSSMFCNGAIWSTATAPAVDRCCYNLRPGAVDGRPFVVAGESRQASVVARSDWTKGRAPSPATLDRQTRAHLADAWRSDARAEHASIATFARLSLELLSLGAPAELVADAHRAAIDEIEHARLCFGLASNYSNEPSGPGRLSMAHALRDITLTELAVAAVAEGCVGETMAAVIAGERLDRAVDPAVRAALATIAEDEARHAALAWRTVVWAIEQGGPSVALAVRHAFARALAPYLDKDAKLSACTDGGDALEAHGHLPRETARELESTVARDVIVPLVVALGTRHASVAAKSARAACA